MSQEEARRRVDQIEAKHATELEMLEERNRKLRSKLLESTHDNTRRLREVADLSSRQFTLEKVQRMPEEWTGGELFLCLRVLGKNKPLRVRGATD